MSVCILDTAHIFLVTGKVAGILQLTHQQKHWFTKQFNADTSV